MSWGEPKSVAEAATRRTKLGGEILEIQERLEAMNPVTGYGSEAARRNLHKELGWRRRELAKLKAWLQGKQTGVDYQRRLRLERFAGSYIAAGLESAAALDAAENLNNLFEDRFLDTDKEIQK